MKQTAMEKNRLEEVSSPRASERAAGTVEGANGRASLIWGNLRRIQGGGSSAAVAAAARAGVSRVWDR